MVHLMARRVAFRRLRRMAIAGTAFALACALATPAQAATTGHADSTLGAKYGQPDPTPPKPEHRLWYAANFWWGLMPSSKTTGYTIWQLTRSGAWADTGIVVDRRSNSGADTFYNGKHLFVATHQFTPSYTNATGAPASLLRFSMTGGHWVQDKGFPVPMMSTSVSAVSIGQDRTGHIVAAYVASAQPWYVATTADADTDQVAVSFTPPQKLLWNNVADLDPATAGDLIGEDIAAVSASNGFTTIVWSNQSHNAAHNGFYSARHRDGATFFPESWTAMAVTPPGANSADNHIALASLPDDTKGRIFAVLKTSKNDPVNRKASDPQLLFAVFTPTNPDDQLAGTWRAVTFTTVAQGGTRPVILIDRTIHKARVFFAAPFDAATITPGHNQGTIFEKDVDYEAVGVPTGRGTVVQRDGHDLLDDPTSTAQNIDAPSGAVVESYARRTLTGAPGHFWHSGAPGAAAFGAAAVLPQAGATDDPSLAMPTGPAGPTKPVPTFGSRAKDALSKVWDLASGTPGRYVSLTVIVVGALVPTVLGMRRRTARRRRRAARETYGYYNR
jgi:hypothetical protein